MRTAIFIFLILLIAGCAEKPEVGVKERAPGAALQEEAVELPTSTIELNQQGAQLIHEDKWEEAEVLFRRALEIDPEDGAAHNNLGFCLQKKGDIAGAIEGYEKALEYSGDPTITHQARLNLAYLYMNTPQDSEVRQPDWPQKAAEQLEALVKTKPNSAPYHMWLGLAYFRATNPGGGFVELQKASELADTKEEAWVHEQIRDFYLQIKMVDKVAEEQALLEKYTGGETGKTGETGEASEITE